MALQRSSGHLPVSNPQRKAKDHNYQKDSHHVKRIPSSPQGGPKKRSAFVDLTNTNKVKSDARVKSGKPVKSATRKVSCTSNSSLKESKYLSSEEHSRKTEAILEETLSTGTGTSPFKEQCAAQQPLQIAVPEQKIPDNFDIDKEMANDYLMSPEYAKDIFDYLKDREDKFVLTDYMHTQSDLNGSMRGVLVDWMVEVQENFELNHETLYLAVKLMDHYLCVKETMRESLQLIGSTAMLIAAKFEERYPPSIGDFMYICDDAYQRHEFLSMEQSILQELKFDINIPVPYRFLRRYAKVAHANMETLTLARYMCEQSLLEQELMSERASRLASACLLLALITKGLGGWTATLQYHSGYTLNELGSLVRRLYAMLASPADENLKAVQYKYSHKVFFEVAKIPLVHIETLEYALLELNISL